MSFCLNATTGKSLVSLDSLCETLPGMSAEEEQNAIDARAKDAGLELDEEPASEAAANIESAVEAAATEAAGTDASASAAAAATSAVGT